MRAVLTRKFIRLFFLKLDVEVHFDTTLDFGTLSHRESLGVNAANDDCIRTHHDGRIALNSAFDLSIECD